MTPEEQAIVEDRLKEVAKIDMVQIRVTKQTSIDGLKTESVIQHT